ncbi:MAG: M14 family metallopeptidase [Gemmatimonadota bacterium]
MTVWRGPVPSLARALAVSAALVLAGFGPAPLSAQEVPVSLLTAPERTDHRETTRYEEVVAFMRAVTDASPLIHLTSFGYSLEGRSLPLAVVGRVADASPESVRSAGKTVVYLQGNIHAGEVEGKEILLILLREISEGRHGALLDSLVLLVAPILNADGNERINLTNRGAQHGPIGGTGTRANAQGLNINRDHMKLDSPEGRSFARLLTEYDPHVAADLHTTNGTEHGYHLTFSPPLHPNTHPEIVAIARERIFPEMTARVREETGWHFYYYGNLQGQGEDRGWATFDHRPRFNNNYLGLRNRIGLLSEAYSYATFEDRMTATRHFVAETLRFASEHATEIRELTARMDAQSVVGERLAVRAAVERSEAPVEILLGSVTEEVNPYSGARMLRRTDEVRSERMWEFGTFQATATEVVPGAYYIPAEMTEVLRTLEAHGVRMSPVASGALGMPGSLERFRLEAVASAAGTFEGRVEQTLSGAWEPAGAEVTMEVVEVLVAQPLGRLIFSLLEPRSDDGLANWGFFASALEGASFYPVLRGP